MANIANADSEARNFDSTFYVGLEIKSLRQENVLSLDNITKWLRKRPHIATFMNSKSAAISLRLPVELLVVVGGERDEVLEPEDAVEGARPHDLGLLRVVRDGEVVGVLGHVLQQSAEGGRAAVLVYLEVGLSECQCIACCRGVISTPFRVLCVTIFQTSIKTRWI